ncbi:MAG: glutamate--tRNA ligase family protein, partial [Mariprofundaceae bacterium]|nr:glutamate--tRNA ligase family protein [Mariprofundaceae bacterium]
TRRRIQEEINRMGVAPHSENASDPYPGSCRKLTAEQRRERMSMQHYAWRLDVAAALKYVDKKLSWKDGEGRYHAVKSVVHGDAVIGRKDIGISYHLAVVVDDAAQEITHVIRGEDLRPFTGLHRLLQALLGLPGPCYVHHPLLRNSSGNRLAKRHGAPTIRSLRENGMQPEKLCDMLTQSPDCVWHGTDSLGKVNELTQHLL